MSGLFEDPAAALPQPHDESGAAAEPAGERDGGFERSDSPGVQRVLQDLEGLGQRPVGEHAAAYQDAHERLTRELETAASRIAGAGGAS